MACNERPAGIQLFSQVALLVAHALHILSTHPQLATTTDTNSRTRAIDAHNEET